MLNSDYVTFYPASMEISGLHFELGIIPELDGDTNRLLASDPPSDE